MRPKWVRPGSDSARIDHQSDLIQKWPCFPR